MKKCDICQVEIPEDYGNSLCMDCYSAIEKQQNIEKEQIKEEEAEKIKQDKNSPTNNGEAIIPAQGIQDPNYKTNPEASDKDQVLTNFKQFVHTGKFLWHPTRNMYTAIKDYCMKKATEHLQYPKYVWKPKIVDVGCGSGCGSNILSLEADMVWGIDKNKLSVDFANEVFKREKNGIYYSSQLTYDNIDIMTENRTLMQFNMVVAIEIIEHIEDTDKFLRQIIQFTMKDKRGRVIQDFPTEFFISTPNRNNPKINNDKPKNAYHVREWSKEEFETLLKNYFLNVEILNEFLQPISDNTVTPIVAKCSIPKI